MTSRRYSRARSGLLLTLLAWLTLLAAPLGSAAPASPKITVFAAISLSDALEEASREFTRRTGIEVRHAFASSAQLARQINAGARADVFIAADQNWMDELRRTRRIDPRTERQLAGNRLVVIQPASLRPVPAHSWITGLANGRLATGDPQYVPLGRYAREALTSLGVWANVEPRLVRADNARVATLLVARGEAALGIVYATDARNDRRVRVITRLDASLHSPIIYPAALTLDAQDAAIDYLNFLSSTEGRKFFAAHGFEPPK
jgi:molybdate transport system substrate-binding protein